MKLEFNIDLGNGYKAQWVPWSPDRTILENAEYYANIPDIEHALLLIQCPHRDSSHSGGIRPDTPEVRKVFPDGPFWTLHSLDPLHLEPSIHMINCGCHGWIRNGKWENA